MGNVTDESGGSVSRTVITITNEGTGAERLLVTDAVGLYVGSELPVGYDTIRFEAPGFSRVENDRVKVDVGGERAPMPPSPRRPWSRP